MRHYLLRTMTFISAFLLLASGAAAGTSVPLASTTPTSVASETVVIDYSREKIGRLKAARPSISRPAAGGLPTDLTVERLIDAEGSRELVTTAGLETRASVAATWTARQQIKIFGYREIYTVGFYDGLQQAFHDPIIGDWDHLQGDLTGRRDRQAYRIGSELGLQHARIRAREDAQARLAAQSQDAVNRSHSDAGSISQQDPEIDELTALMPSVREPRLIEVFEDLPLSSVVERSDLGSLPDPVRLYRASDHLDFYDRRWTDSGRALDYWLDHHHDRAFWQQLNEKEKDAFTQVFQSAYRHQLPGLLPGPGEQAYDGGYGDGWDYGLRVVQEWRRRQGYHEGFTSALETHARSAFWKSYPSMFDDRYGELFREWSAGARSETREVALLENSDTPARPNFLFSGSR